jgi:hypothetical protein
MDWGSLLLGALLGFLLSLLLWWIQLRVVVPKLMFGDAISRLTHNGDAVYRFKVLNCGRRGAVDLSVTVSLHLGNKLISYDEVATLKTFSILRLHPSNESILQLRPGVSRVVRLDMRPSLWETASPSLLRVVDIDPTSEDRIALESLLSATPGAYMRIRVLANDEISGTRKYFVSQRYYAGHIRTGAFDEDGLSVGTRGGW